MRKVIRIALRLFVHVLAIFAWGGIYLFVYCFYLTIQPMGGEIGIALVMLLGPLLLISFILFRTVPHIAPLPKHETHYLYTTVVFAALPATLWAVAMVFLAMSIWYGIITGRN